MKKAKLKRLQEELSVITTHAEIDKYGIKIHLESLRYRTDGAAKLLEILQWVNQTREFSMNLNWEISWGYYNDVDGIDLKISFK